MSFTFDWIEAIGHLGAILGILSYMVATMIPLRVIGLLSSIAFIIYGGLSDSLPVMLMEACLLPINAYHLWKLFRLMRRAREAAEGDLSMEWLKPFARRRRCTPGEVLFRRGETAMELFYIDSGRFRLAETGMALGPGTVVGELGFVSPGNRRTQTLECAEPGDLYRISYTDLRQLYFQNPEFGLYLLRLVGERMFRDLAAAEAARPA